jgi:hypothetical protein
MKDQLTELEITKIEQFNADKDLVSAVRKVLLAGLYSHGVIEKGKEPNPLLNGAYSLVSLALENPIPDEIIGQQLRAQWSGINALKNAFDSLGRITRKQEGAVESSVNIAE